MTNLSASSDNINAFQFSFKSISCEPLTVRLLDRFRLGRAGRERLGSDGRQLGVWENCHSSKQERSPHDLA